MLTKMVNGVSINCTPEEEAVIRADWARSEAEPAPAPQPTLADLIEVIKADPAAAARLDARMKQRK